ncbi:MAG: hypothetical protein WDW36_003091 [Sanguina aurantia]
MRKEVQVRRGVAVVVKATVHVDEQGLVVGLTYSVMSPSCGRAPSTSASSSSKAPHSLVTHLSRPLLVVVDTPAFAPALESTIAPAAAQRTQCAAELWGEPGGGSLSRGKRAWERGGGGKPGAKVPVPDDRSWLAKNWMFVLGACMMAFNIITRTSAAPAQAARPAAVAAAPRR